MIQKSQSFSSNVLNDMYSTTLYSLYYKNIIHKYVDNLKIYLIKLNVFILISIYPSLLLPLILFISLLLFPPYSFF